MKKHAFTQIFTVFILLTFSILINSVAYSQITVSHAKQGIPGQQEGFFYALPQTVLKVDFIVKKTTHTVGPYSSFAERMLGVSDVVKADFESFEIMDALISTIAEPDPKAVFLCKIGRTCSKRCSEHHFFPNGKWNHFRRRR